MGDASAFLRSVSTPHGSLIVEQHSQLSATGDILRHSTGSRIGRNDSIPSTIFILLSNITSATFPTNFPSSPIQMQVVSDNVNDTALGTGAQQVTIEYLRSPNSIFGFTKNVEVVTMNGLTPVLTVNTDIFRIDRFHVTRTGSSMSGLGNISLQTAGGATTFEKIDAGTNVFRTCVHYIPNRVKSIVTDMDCSTSTAGGILFILEASEEDAAGNVVTKGQEDIQFASAAIPIKFTIPTAIVNKNNKLMFFAIVVRGKTPNQAGAATIRFMDSLL